MSVLQKVKQKLSLPPASPEAQKTTPPSRLAKTATPTQTAKSASPPRVAKSSPPGRVTKSSSPARVSKPASPVQASKMKALSEAASKASAPTRVTKPASSGPASTPSTPTKNMKSSSFRRISQTSSPWQASKSPSPTQLPREPTIIRVQATQGGALSKKFATYGKKGQGAVIAKGLRRSQSSTQNDRVLSGRCDKSVASPKRDWTSPAFAKTAEALVN